jgi:hypothetical protein
MHTHSLRTVIFGGVLLFALTAVAQPRRRRQGRSTRPAETTQDVNVMANAPAANAETISVPVTDVDHMMRQMRVWLFTPPAGASGYGVGAGTGRRVWALLPSCRHANPDDPRPPCPVDRVIIEPVPSGQVSVSSNDPVGLQPNEGSRRVQGFTVPTGVPRVRVKIMGLNNVVRYDAVVDASNLGELPAPQGSPTANGFNFDLTQYPAR